MKFSGTVRKVITGNIILLKMYLHYRITCSDECQLIAIISTKYRKN